MRLWRRRQVVRHAWPQGGESTHSPVPQRSHDFPSPSNEGVHAGIEAAEEPPMLPTMNTLGADEVLLIDAPPDLMRPYVLPHAAKANRLPYSSDDDVWRIHREERE